MPARTILVRNVRKVPRQMNVIATRNFIASTQRHKTVTETIKDAAKTVDKTVSKGAIKGLDGLEKVNEGVKGAAGKVGIKLESKPDPLLDDVETGAEATATKAQGKGEQVKRDAKAGVRDAADKVKDAAS